MSKSLREVTAILAAVVAWPAGAEVTASSEAGFVSSHSVVVPAVPQAAWETMLRPGEWWSGDHSYSGDAANMAIAPVAGGCFCEAVPGADGASPGQVEHMRVLYLVPGSTLRMSGGLGPLQGEAVTGVLTVSLQPADQGTRITWDYVVGGYMRLSMVDMAPLVDRVIGDQLSRLAAHLNGH